MRDLHTTSSVPLQAYHHLHEWKEEEEEGSMDMIQVHMESWEGRVYSHLHLHEKGEEGAHTLDRVLQGSKGYTWDREEEEACIHVHRGYTLPTLHHHGREVLQVEEHMGSYLMTGEAVVPSPLPLLVDLLEPD